MVSGIRFASLWNDKARKWISGRKGVFDQLEKKFHSNAEPLIWIHCASLGEFEQGRPVIEKLKKEYPEHKILLTFFSPSGYEIRKDYKGADFVFYLPADTSSNAKEFIKIVQPSLVIFVKYEYWYHYLKTIYQNQIPLLLISGIFRKDQPFFKWYGSLHRKMLHFFSHFFVQDENSFVLLNNLGFKDTTSIAGDTRFDRVIEIAENFQPIPAIEKFIQDDRCIVTGSTWKDDEEALASVSGYLNDLNVKMIIAPHEINQEHLQSIKKLFSDSIFFSEYSKELTGSTDKKVLIIDNIGMLSKLYHYAYIAYIGGGFTKTGIHNCLEAAVYGKPVIFGPTYNKYTEAIELLNAGGATSYKTTEDLREIISTLLTNSGKQLEQSMAAKKYVLDKKGATEKVIQFIQENRLLTSR
ncbi:MAG: 3-deoxy-D-manno-octulosonic acid transferase [Bacteroidetes bacterium]|nr:3-deoxy-D-manno-octulosonic acid transferase [Bacteroidota bacterium]